MRFSECLADYRDRFHPSVEVKMAQGGDKVEGLLQGFSDATIQILPGGEKISRIIPTSGIRELEVMFHGTENPGGGETDGSGNEHCVTHITHCHKLTRGDGPDDWRVKDLTKR